MYVHTQSYSSQSIICVYKVLLQDFYNASRVMMVNKKSNKNVKTYYVNKNSITLQPYSGGYGSASSTRTTKRVTIRARVGNAYHRILSLRGYIVDYRTVLQYIDIARSLTAQTRYE